VLQFKLSFFNFSKEDRLLTQWLYFKNLMICQNDQHSIIWKNLCDNRSL